MFFADWGLLEQLPLMDYYNNILLWVCEDYVEGYMIVSNEATGELRYVECRGK